ncbi:MAG TPA: hypothetical protein VLC79_02650 [Cellvibrio sp.]|jgi:hypothetical protein|nr:hypothetical protein [Cellvibrio sp.]
MDVTIDITPHEHYLHVKVSGMANYENAVHFWKSIVEASEKYQCYRILGEQNLLNSVTTLEAFDHPALFKQLGITTKFQFAWVDNNPRTRDTTEFVYNVLANRAISTGRMFYDVETAKQWLLSKS